MPTVEKILEGKGTTAGDVLRRWLTKRGYDGLCNAWGECGCGVDDLAPCDSLSTDCQAAYRRTASCSETGVCGKDGAPCGFCDHDDMGGYYCPTSPHPVPDIEATDADSKAAYAIWMSYADGMSLDDAAKSIARAMAPERAAYAGLREVAEAARATLRKKTCEKVCPTAVALAMLDVVLPEPATKGEA